MEFSSIAVEGVSVAGVPCPSNLGSVSVLVQAHSNVQQSQVHVARLNVSHVCSDGLGGGLEVYVRASTVLASTITVQSTMLTNNILQGVVIASRPQEASICSLSQRPVPSLPHPRQVSMAVEDMSRSPDPMAL